MDDFDKMLREAAAEDRIKMPESVRLQMEETLAALPVKSGNGEKQGRVVKFSRASKLLASAACIAFAMIFVMPNISPAYAQAVEKIPVIGDIVRVVTIRNYLYDDPYHQMDIKVPQVSDMGETDAAEFINKDVDELTQQLVEQFYAELAAVGNEGYGSVYVDYETKLDTDRWFSLGLSVFMESGSGNQFYVYYNVDKTTGEIVKFGDLFNTPDYGDVIVENLKEQMRRRMAADSNEVYWIDDMGFGSEFNSVDYEHNFYFNADGNLVIPFDEYEVTPGSAGSPEFVIEIEDIQDILKDEYKSIDA